MKHFLTGILYVFALALATSGAAMASSFDQGYSDWAALLERHLRDDRVDYAALQKDPGPLESTLQAMQAVSRQDYDTWSPSQQIAFWLNAYNAATIKMVLDHYPLDAGFNWKAVAFPKNSIQQIPKVWKRDALEVFGKPRSLNYIEHEVLRARFEEPRIHFALVCASIGCPPLRDEPYVGARLDAQLDDQLVQFLGDRKKFRYDGRKDVLHVSPILSWFEEDFEKAGGVVPFLKRHIPRDINEHVTDNTGVRWLRYDWNLNDKR